MIQFYLTVGYTLFCDFNGFSSDGCGTACWWLIYVVLFPLIVIYAILLGLLGFAVDLFMLFVRAFDVGNCNRRGCSRLDFAVHVAREFGPEECDQSTGKLAVLAERVNKFVQQHSFFHVESFCLLWF